MRSKLLANAAVVLVGIALISCRDVISPKIIIQIVILDYSARPSCY